MDDTVQPRLATDGAFSMLEWRYQANARSLRPGGAGAGSASNRPFKSISSSALMMGFASRGWLALAVHLRRAWEMSDESTKPMKQAKKPIEPTFGFRKVLPCS
jgi:hypothetical protein